MENKPMRTAARLADIAIAVGAICLVSGCASQQNVVVHTESAQVFSPTTLVQVLPALPAQRYVRIAVLDVQAPAGTPLAQLQAQLQAKAGSLGANAIVVQNLSTSTAGALQFNPAGGTYTTAPAMTVPHLRAIAIRIEPAAQSE